ncbi:MAG: hypothetical protein AB8V06_03705 [Francisella endosymbiont of Hyalomma asiaticum]
MLKSKPQQLRASQKNDYIKVAFNIATVVFVYVIVSLIAFSFVVANFKADSFLMTLYILGNIFMLTGFVLAVLRYRFCLLFLVIGFTFLIITILSIIVLLYGYLKNIR